MICDSSNSICKRLFYRHAPIRVIVSKPAQYTLVNKIVSEQRVAQIIVVPAILVGLTPKRSFVTGNYLMAAQILMLSMVDYSAQDFHHIIGWTCRSIVIFIFPEVKFHFFWLLSIYTIMIILEILNIVRE